MSAGGGAELNRVVVLLERSHGATACSSLSHSEDRPVGRPALHDTGFWAAHVSRQQASQLSVREYCRREGLEPHQFYNGRRRAAKGSSLGGGQSAPERHALQRHHVGAAATSASSMVVIQLNNGEASIHVPAERHDTIEAVLRLSMHLCEPAKKQSPGSGFRSIVVR